jgi:uncharacterized membrane protein
MNNNQFVTKLVKNAIVAALYMVLTLAIAPLAYGDVQFRISEIMLLLMLMNSAYAPGLILGCLLANLFSPLGVIDVVVGTSATALAVVFMSKTKNQIVATLWPTLFNGIIVGLELYFVFQLPLVMSMISVAIGEFVVVTCIGLPIFKLIMANKRVVNILN